MKLLKFNEFLNEDIVPLGFAMASSPSFYTLSSSQIRTGYDMQPVVGSMLTASDNIANAAIDHENNDNPDHTGRGYINEALKMFKEKCNEAYDKKCNEGNTTNESVINENKFTSHGHTFTVSPISVRGLGITFIPDEKTLDNNTREELVSFLEKNLHHAVGDVSSCLSYDKNNDAAGIVFTFDIGDFATLLSKKMK